MALEASWLQWLHDRAARRPLVAKLLENATWLMFERVAALALAFVVNAWLVRHLGPGEYGRYAYALSFVSLFGSIAALGQDPIVVRELARHPDRDGEILGTALILRACAGLVAWAASVVAVLPFRGDTPTRIVVAIVGLNVLFTAMNVFELWFQAAMAARRLVMTRTGVAVLSQAVRAGLILVGAQVSAFALLVTVTGAGTTLVLWAAYRGSRQAGSRLRWSGAWAGTLLKDAWPMILVALGIAVSMKIDQVMLASMIGDRATGLYAPAVALSEVWYFIPVAMGAAAYPAIVRAVEEYDQGQLQARLQAFYDAMAFAGYLVTAGVLLTADVLVPFLYGPEYHETATILEIHVLSFVFVSLGVARGRFLYAKNLIGFTLAATLGGAGLNVALNLVLLPRYGPTGAAWATVLSYAAANVLSGLFWRPLWTQTGLLTRALFLPVRSVGIAATAGWRAVKR